jgi:hypothetical protein
MSGSIQRVKWRSSVQIQSAASVVRRAIGWSDRPGGDILKALEHPGCASIGGLEVFVLEDDELLHAEAEYIDQLRQIHVRNSVATFAYNGDGHARWTLSHELGHAVLHRGELTYPTQRSATSLDRLKLLEPNVNSEWQADQFAKGFLMPVDLCVDMSSAREIQQRCGVSEIAARYRFNELAALRKVLRK